MWGLKIKKLCSTGLSRWIIGLWITLPLYNCEDFCIDISSLCLFLVADVIADLSIIFILILSNFLGFFLIVSFSIILQWEDQHPHLKSLRKEIISFLMQVPLSQLHLIAGNMCFSTENAMRWEFSYMHSDITWCVLYICIIFAL